jgi:hypothetical protein
VLANAAKQLNYFPRGDNGAASAISDDRLESRQRIPETEIEPLISPDNHGKPAM